MKLLLIIPLILLALSRSGNAQGVVKVVDQNGNNLPGVKLDTNSQGVALTDEKGEWPFFTGISGSQCAQLPPPPFIRSISKPGYSFDRTSFQIPCPSLGAIRVVGTGTALPSWANVSAAHYQRGLASEMIVAAFGTALAETTASAVAQPLPTSLGGRSVKLFHRGVERFCPLLFVSPRQVNFVLPFFSVTQDELALLTLSDGTNPIREELVTLKQVAPALFTVDATGRGLAAAVIVRVTTEGTQVIEPVARFDSAQDKFVPVPIEFTANTARLFLSLFGTGLHPFPPLILSQVSVKVGGTDAPVQYAGPQGTLAGLDQLNVELPRSLMGRGLVDVAVTVNANQSHAANLVQVSFK